MPAEAEPIYEFGGFRLLRRERLLLRDGSPVRLTPKAFDLLVYFVERPGRLVEKAALLDALWPDVAVEEANLAFQVSALRKALEPGGADLIQTVPTKGYRFVASVVRYDGETANSPGHESPPAVTSSTPDRARSRPSWIAITGIAIAIVAGFLWAWRTSRSAPGTASTDTPSPPKVVRLTSGPGLQTDATWSPDGTAFAYTSDRSGTLDIWVQRVGGGDARPLTTAPSHDDQPAWSPDGDVIVFHSDRDGGGLFVVPAAGGPERRLTTFGVRPRWAPDGSRILFASTDVHDFGRSIPKLYTVTLDGRAPVEVPVLFARTLGVVADWGWYPDSHRLSVLGLPREGAAPALFTAPLDGGAPAVLQQGHDGNPWLRFTWGSPGNSLYVATVVGFREVERLAIDATLTRLERRERIAASDDSYGGLAVSRDGRRLAFTLERNTQRLWSVPLDAAGQVAGPGGPVTDPALRIGTSALSWDGRWLAYEAERPSVGTELWLTDLRDLTSRPLASDGQERGGPVWSRDGSRLAYAWFGPGGQAPVVRHIESGAETPLIAPIAGDVGARMPGGGWMALASDWSPDGTSLLTSSHRGDAATLELMPAAPAQEGKRIAKVLTADAGSDMWEAHYSPNGRWIAFDSNDRPDRPGESRIMVMPASGVPPHQWIALTPEHEWADKPRWSPDGRLLYYIRWGGSYWNVWALPVDPNTARPAGRAFQVTHFDSPRHQLSTRFQGAEISVAPGVLIVTIAEREGSIWMAER